MNNVIYSLCGLGILTLGIAHGAIDNILYGAKPGKSNIHFIIKYLVIVALFALTWFALPNLAFLLFLGVSAYHFGQSQFAEYKFRSKLLSKGLFFSWGSIVLFLMFFFNGEEIVSYQSTYLDFYTMLNHLINYSTYYLLGSSSLYFILLLFAMLYEKISFQSLFKEIYLLGLIACSMYIFPVFIAFSLFFVWMHSLQVIRQELEYCKEKLQIGKIRDFIILFLPLTSVSIVATAAIVLLIIALNMEQYIPYVLLIILSCITIPHSFVMEKFYDKLST
jgi:Brp/Blh family beta-carotene 15,15'-monooxygenase